MKCMIGADPELFVKNKKSGKFISAHDLIPGTKEAPFPTDLGAIQVDGVAAEFNIYPTSSLEQFSANIFHTINDLNTKIQERSKDYELVAVPTAFFDDAYFKVLPLRAKALGCQPDFNAYTLKENKKPETKEPFRTGSGHVHIGWGDFPITDDHLKTCAEVTKQLDTVLYVPSLLWDKDNRRRLLYGSMGSFRPKTYGVEYRCLSNAWVFNPKLHKFIFNTVQIAMEMFFQGVKLWELPAYVSVMEDLRNNKFVRETEIVDFYYDLLIEDRCEELPKNLINVV